MGRTRRNTLEFGFDGAGGADVARFTTGTEGEDL
jgi:hypothetical protein